MSEAYEKRRFRIYKVDYRMAFDLFWVANRKNLDETQRVCLPIIDGVPEDASIQDVMVNWEYREICFLVVHPSFDEVPVGQLATTFEAFRVKSVVFRVQDGDGADMPLLIREKP